MATSWLPTGFYDPFFSDPLLGTDFEIMDWDMGAGPTDWGATAAGGAAGAGWPQLAGRGGDSQRGTQAGQQPGGTRAQRRANRRTARVNLVQEDDKYLVCVEVAGRTKNDLCVALEGNMLKVCGKALEADDEELEQQKQHFTGQTEAGKTPIQGPSGQQPPETPPQQSQQAQARTATEGKEAELSGGEKISERREGGQQAQAGQQQPQRQRRYLIHEFPVGRIERTIRLPADAQEEGIQAKCENGILHVCVPRLPKKRPVEIQ